MPDCIDPVMGERVLDQAREGSGLMRPDLATHAETCEACRIGAERLRRLARSWRALEPSPADVSAAHVKFVMGRRRQGRASEVPKGLALAIVLFAAAAIATPRFAKIAHRWVHSIRSLPAAAEAPGERPTADGTPRNHPAAKGHGPVPDEPDSLEAEPNAAVSAKPEGSSVVLPDPVHVEPHAVSSKPGAPLVTEREAAPAQALSSAWVLAADAMRAGDYTRAERAFDELARSPDGSTRDAARLARAEVWLSRGRTVEARPELESLARSGATAFIRARAAEELDALRGAKGP